MLFGYILKKAIKGCFVLMVDVSHCKRKSGENSLFAEYVYVVYYCLPDEENYCRSRAIA